MPILPCRPLSCSPEINHAAITCDSCGEGTPICCLKITRPSWDQYVIVKRTGYTIGDSCTGTSATNFCGRLTAAVSAGGDSSQCFMDNVFAAWSNNGDCDVMFSVGFPSFWSGGVIVPAKTFSGVVPSNWNASTLSLDSWDESETITVEVCDGTEEIFPPSDPDLMLKATLWVDAGSGLSSDIPADLFGGGMFDPPVQKYARGNGTTICGIAQLCEGDTVTPEQMWWYYERDTGDVRVTIATPGGAVSSTPSTADFAWSETWADAGFVVPLPTGVLGSGITGEWRVVKVTDCSDPGECDQIACLPKCVVKDCDGTNYTRPLYLTVTGCPDLAELAPSEFPTVDGGGFQSGTFGYGATSPPGEPPVARVQIDYFCDGAGLKRTVTVEDTDAAGYTVGPTSVSNACSGGSWSDTFTLDLLDCGVTTFDVFSDGTDSWSPL